MRHAILLLSFLACIGSQAQSLQLDTLLTPDLRVDSTANVINGAGTTCCRFYCTYFGERAIADFSPDDENSDVSVIEAVGSGSTFTAFLNLVRTTHRDRFQSWYTRHKAL